MACTAGWSVGAVPKPDSATATLLQRIQSTRDNQGRPFAILNKQLATLHVFAADGQERATSPVLLGLAHGDRSVPGIGTRKIADILPQERTTPAGRFVTEPGLNTQDEDIVWIDYDAAVSMHRLRATHQSERRPQRLASPTPDDNRITYGCVNVPAHFYDNYIKPVFGRVEGIVYILPESGPGKINTEIGL
ncbi:MAG: L,D-transpeptidase [Candidatus Saccharibacteria bacterium]|nr:L,D-transpeptidase [Rhodoferax sp.]